jgi:hypothetical protein
MLFVSKIRDLRLIRRPADRVMDEQRRPIILKGERVEFANWRFSTEDPDLIDWLTHHREYGVTFTSDKMKDKAVEQPEKVVLRDTDDEMPRHLRTRPQDKFAEIHAKNIRSAKKEKRNLQKIKKAQQNPQMIKGMLATSYSIPESVRQHLQEQGMGPGEPAQERGVQPLLTEERVTELISNSVNEAMGQILEVIKGIQAPKAKRTFHCPECGEEFASGIAVGKHKKEAHA